MPATAGLTWPFMPYPRGQQQSSQVGPPLPTAQLGLHHPRFHVRNRKAQGGQASPQKVVAVGVGLWWG